MDNKLFLSEVFGFEGEPAIAATLDESSIPAEEPAGNKTYVPSAELGKLSSREFAKSLVDASWDDDITAPDASLEKRVRMTATYAEQMGIVKTEIVDEDGFRFSKAFNAKGELVAERLLGVA